MGREYLMHALAATMVILGSYSTLYVLYDLFLYAVHILTRDAAGPAESPGTRFCVLIPAHDEGMLLPRLLKSASEQDYPKELVQTVVVADNCTDDTACVASALDAIAMERRDPDNTGKGHALRWALERLDLGKFDAIFVVDADSFLGDGLFRELDKLVRQGKDAIQCYNGVANPDESWFTRLLNVSRTIGNEIIHPAKQRLGLSSYLMGNGMCFSSRFLRKHPWGAFSVGEDWEYYATLVRAGEVIAFGRDARVYHQESYSLRQATPQRMRWSSGRFAIAWNQGFKLLFEGLIERDAVKADASLPLLFPNPSLGMNISLILLCISVAYAGITKETHFVYWFGLLAALQILMFLYGILYTKGRLMNLASLFLAPVFLAWKLGIDALSLIGFGRKNWRRTERRSKKIVA